MPSEFVRRAFVASGVSLPCRIVPPQLEPPAPASPDRARFGIDADAFAVLFAFSLRSGVVRKNAMAAVRAFLKAFPDNGDVRLIFKISDVDIEGAAWKDFRTAVGNDPRFVFITEFFTDHEMLSLYASIDVALSTHRAEGYGMIPALAMLCGRVAVATGWSANLDFMTPDNSICSLTSSYLSKTSTNVTSSKVRTGRKSTRTRQRKRCGGFMSIQSTATTWRLRARPVWRLILSATEMICSIICVVGGLSLRISYSASRTVVRAPAGRDRLEKSRHAEVRLRLCDAL